MTQIGTQEEEQQRERLDVPAEEEPAPTFDPAPEYAPDLDPERERVPA